MAGSPWTARPVKGNRAQRAGVTTTRQPRPKPRRQGTRSGILAAATREG
jgi:hypothetical protein